MDRTALKKYAPQARRDFIAAITDRAGFYGLTKKHVEPVTVEGNVAIIGGRPFDRSVALKRMGLERRIAREGFDAVMEAIAYTWFNRFVAIRYMELHGYLDHGYRVLSHPQGKDQPEILDHAQHVQLYGLSPQRVIDLKLAGDKDADLYRMLLVAQCNALYLAMPFLFERIDDETELLLPDNLLHTDSLVRRLVRDIPEENWQEIEVIGWIYQFYISEKKDEVIGKVVKSEDIPAATQLFTPNWIVKYLVQNSIGRQWLATYPDSPLRKQMEYYIEPAEQTPEVQTQLKAITPESLNPEEMTLLDPACGSGHILVEAYDLFKAIYQERGYRAKDIPRLILRNNLFGLEIDDRAAQLAAFALIMKARADDRRVLEGGIRMNVRCIQSSDGLKAEEIYEALTGVDVVDKSGLPPAEEFGFIEEVEAPLIAHLRKESAIRPQDSVTDQQPPVTLSDIRTLLALFKGDDAKTFGSLICIPERLAGKLVGLVEQTDRLVHGDDLSRRVVALALSPIAEQASILGIHFDAVVANPPYLGGNAMNTRIKTFVQATKKHARHDLYLAFIERGRELAKASGVVSMITMHSWMFISRYQEFREEFLSKNTIMTMAHLGARAFDSISGAVVQTVAFTMRTTTTNAYIPSIFRLTEGDAPEKEISLREKRNLFSWATQESFSIIPGSPIVYWLPLQILNAFRLGVPLHELATPRVGMITGDNDQFLRYWTEVSIGKVGLRFGDRLEAKASGRRWFPYQKGGPCRRWFGNIEFLVNWENDGWDLRNTRDANGKVPAHAFNDEYIFKPNVNWSKLSTVFGARYASGGNLFDDAGSGAFADADTCIFLTAFLNTPLAQVVLSSLNPTLNYQAWNIGALPLAPDYLKRKADVIAIAKRLIEIAKTDWDSLETSWDFKANPLIAFYATERNLPSSFDRYAVSQRQVVAALRELEIENNKILVECYEIEGNVDPEVACEAVTLWANPYHRHGLEGTREFPHHLVQQRSILDLLSYAIGCTMGRYSLDEPGLIYAHSDNGGFDPSRYTTFPADADGIIPLTEYAWFDDDATNRFVEFIGVVWPKEHLEENLDFVAESLGTKSNESSRDTIRRYLATGFYKDHLQTYKRRPFYWLFSSGKERAFQCLVYLHRYNEGTLARMRTEYVIPLQGKMNARIEHLKHDIAAATSTAHGKKLQKEHDTLKKHLEELRTFDEKLNHYAAQRIPLDLDDGVKVNYAKFGDLLAEVKAVTGGKPEEE